MYRHGDVLLIRRGDAPEPQVSDERQVVVAEGEVTGHAHRVTGVDCEYRDESDDTGAYDDVLDRHRLYLPQGGVITHEEHGEIALPPGVYEVRIQQTLTQRGVWERVRD